MGRVITATTMNGSRQASQNHSKNEYGDREAVSPTSSDFSNPRSSTTEVRDQPQAEPEFMASKKYCCSNSAQSESKIWAIFDIVTACLVFIVQVYFTITLKADRQLLQAIVDSNKDNERDLNRFLQYSPLKQDLILTVVITREIVSVLLGTLLYTAAKLRAQQQLKIWLGSTFIAIVVDLFLFIPKMAFTQNKFLYVSGMIAYFLYKWYEVWIVTLLFKELRQEEADSKLVGDVHRTLESERFSDKDKPPDIGTVSSSVNQLVRTVGPGVGQAGKTFPTQMNPANMGHLAYTGMETISRRGTAGRDSLPGEVASHVRGYDSARIGSVGWDPDPMGSSSTFILQQPPKRLKFQPRAMDMDLTLEDEKDEVEHFRSSRY